MSKEHQDSNTINGDRAQIEKKLYEMVVSHFGVQQTDVVPTALFVEDFNADSLTQVELIMTLEEEFGVNISDKEAQDLRSVQDVVNCLDKKLNEGDKQ